MTWWRAYGQQGAAEEIGDVEDQQFTPIYTPGTKPLTVVLLPTLLLASWMWEKVHEQLQANGWPVIQFEESISLVSEHTSRTVNRLAAKLKVACGTITDQPFVTAGDSLGGLVAFEIARSFPHEVAGLVASGAPGLNMQVTDFVRQLAGEARSPQDFADSVLDRMLYDRQRHDIDPARYEGVVTELAESEHLRSMLGAMRAISRYNSRKVVTSIDTPKLFIWGRQDRLTPPEEWERMTPKMTNARMVTFDECGHVPMFERPEEYYPELEKFLQIGRAHV